MPHRATHSVTAEPLDRERDRPHPLQIDLYRRATPTAKLAALARLNATAIAIKEADLKTRRPDLPAAERRAALRQWWLASRD
jgi:hypothetical protein